MHFYSFSFSLMVVERFTNARPRGWDVFHNNLDDFYMEDLAEIFQKSRKQWNILKKLIKLCDRDPRPNYYTYVKLKELYRYFERVHIQETHPTGLTRGEYVDYLLGAPKS